jgi:Beta-propeller domains of methanol dehydrogenase type
MKMNFLTKLSMAENGTPWCGHPVRHTRLRIFVLFLAFVLCIAQTALAQKSSDLFPPKPEPAVYVHDYANWLTPAEKNDLEQKLRAYWDSTSTQIVVMVRPDLGDYDRAGYAFELGNRWGVGRTDKDNGVVMVIKTEAPDRGVFIATGYGTEGALPDITAGRIIRNTMVPYFREDRRYEGINAGLDEIIRALSGEYTRETAGEKLSKKEGLIVALIILFFIFMIFFFIARAMKNASKWITHDGSGPVRRNKRNDDWWMGGGWGGGSSGGSWGGGGSSWGGGGGSFGGGSFGGGGAGGGW